MSHASSLIVLTECYLPSCSPRKAHDHVHSQQGLCNSSKANFQLCRTPCAGSPTLTRSLWTCSTPAMAHNRAQYGTDLQSTSQDMLTALDRSAMALNMVARTLENEFAERFGHTGVRSICKQ